MVNLKLKPKPIALLTAIGLSAGIILSTIGLLPTDSIHAAGGSISVNILAAPNFVVDSNVESPSTYAPSVATIGVEFCNTGNQPLANVQGFIGDFIAGTPGSYPTRDSSTAAFMAEHPHLANGGLYAFTHIGGRAGLKDASRYIGSLAVGECKYQYWHITYPRRANPNNSGVAVWGQSSVPEDDLWLELDAWATAVEALDGLPVSADDTHRATMRNEISAMANKIQPQGGAWFNTNTGTIYPGDLITSNGVLYELGNINKGFDNDGDGDFDYNAWLQPIGDPSYDPSCFRLVRTSGIITVSRSGGQPDLIIPFTDQLYFTDLPPDNTSTIGNIHYTFLALDGPCNTALTPYQEVASGADNEKFNGDYGASIPPLSSFEPKIDIDKMGKATIQLGDTINYEIPAANTGPVGAGLPLVSSGSSGASWVPLVFSDTIPAGMIYVPDSATHTFTSSGVIILFSTDDGATWSDAEPAVYTDVTSIQWWLTDTLRSGHSGSVLFEVTVAATFGGSFVENCAAAGFGGGVSFGQACTITLVEGPNSIGDTVWQDDNGNGLQDGAETGLANITVNLYLDRDGDGIRDDDDLLITSTVTSGTGSYLFNDLPAGDFLVQVDRADPNLPFGFSPTTEDSYAVTLVGSDFLAADFGFGPSLSILKRVIGSSALEGNEIQYVIDLTNLRPGDGSGLPTSCTYNTWATAHDAAHSGSGPKVWTNIPNAFSAGGPDGLYAKNDYGQGFNRKIAGSGFAINRTGVITRVEAIFLVYISQALSNDDAEAELFFNNVRLGIGSFTETELNNLVSPANVGFLTWDVTSLRAWDWADFSGDLDMSLAGAKTGGADSTLMFMDAMGFRITTDQSCGGPNDTLNPVPLTDTYDADRLEFVSATPSESSLDFTTTPYANTGVISWTNVGPIFAGQTRSVTVTFRGLEPPDNDGDGENDPATITNTAIVSGATFVTAEPANDDEDEAVTTLQPTGSIGDTVWNDNGGPTGAGSGGNGIQDGDEQGIPNVVIELYDGTSTLIMTTTTTITGYYLFEGLVDDDYTVRVATTTLPGNSFTQTGDPEGCPGPNCDNQSDVTLNNNDNNPSNDNNNDRDFGYTIPNTIFGNIWEDNDGDASQDLGENGFGNLTVFLDNCGPNGACGDGDDGSTISVQTDAAGNYVFSDLPDGNYRARVDTNTLPPGGAWAQTVDPDASLDGQTNTIAVSGGNVYGSFDFAYTQNGNSDIGDTIYTDWNGDGDQDAGEEGISGVTVTLYEDANGDGAIDPTTDAVVMTATTTISGYYLFTNLPAGDFIIVVDEDDLPFPPGGYQQTADPDASLDSQASVTTDGSTDQPGFDFGYQPVGTGSIGDFVWRDDDRDGLQDVGEPGLANILVTLYEDSDGDGVINPLVDAVMMTATTDFAGSYLFENLPAGDYMVNVDPTDPDLPTDGYGNAYILSTNNNSLAITLSAAQDYLEADFGFTTGGVIGDFVWQDADQNGTPDPNEPGIDKVTVWLYTWNDIDSNGIYSSGADTLGGLISTTTTVSGTYLFTGLPAGDFVVIVDTADPNLPSNIITFDPDNDFDAAVGVSLSPGQIFNGADFGFAGSGVIGDALWIDINDNGTYDPGEVGIPGVVITLTNGAGTAITTTTDNDGYYIFSDLTGDTYTVTVQTSDLPAGLVHSFEADGTLDHLVTTTLNSGQIILTIDFGYVPALNVSKTSSSGGLSLSAGDTLTYTIVVSNPSSVLVTGATISDTIPANTNFVAGSAAIIPPSAGDVGSLSPIYINPLTITANSLVTITYQITVAAPFPFGVNVITNTVDLTTTFDMTDTNTITEVVISPAIAIAKTPDTQLVETGGTVTFTLSITNTGDVSLDPVVVSDALAPNCDNATLGPLAPGSSTSYICIVTNVTAAFTNTAVVSGTSPPGNTVTDTDNAQVSVQSPVIGLAKSVSNTINNGDGSYNVDYTLIVENLGDVPLTNVQITDDLSITFAAAGGFALIAGPIVTPSLNPNLSYDGIGDINLLSGGDTLAVGEVTTVTFTVQVTPGLNPGPYTNTAFAEGASPTGATVNDQSDDGANPDPDGDGNPSEPGEDDPTPVSFSGVEIDLQIQKTDGGMIAKPGGVVAYTLSYTNTGAMIATGVVITETVPANTTFNPGSSDPGWLCLPAGNAGGTCALNIGPVAANGGSGSVIFAVTLADPLPDGVSQVANSVVIGDDGSHGPDDNPGDNTDDDTTPLAALEVSKLVSVATAAPTQIVTYTIMVANTGGVIINPVLVTDTLSGGLTYIPGSANPAPIQNGQQLTWPDVTGGAGLAPNQMLQITFLAQVTTAIGIYNNVVLVEASYPGGSITDTDEVSVVVEDPSVLVTKGINAPGAVNGLITFTIRITNTGPSTLDVLPLIDRFNGPVEYVGGTPPANSVDNQGGVLIWNDLTLPGPDGFGQDLVPGQMFVINTVFRVTASTNSFSMTNTAIVTEAQDTFGNDANDDDTISINNEPTAVDLLYFKANQQGQYLRLTWATAVEYDSFGFRLLRSSTGNLADAVEIAFVPGQGHGNHAGANYVFIDKDIQASQTYSYWLVDVDFSGAETAHGPQTITAVAITGGNGDFIIFLPLIFNK